MDSCFYDGDVQHIPFFYSPDYQLKKAKYSNIYVVKEETSTNSPNFFSTIDFKKFKPITSIAPEKKFNWLRSELVSYQLTDGRTSQGILYKPENFDKNKKYPVIFYYYFFNENSNKLNNYFRPEVSRGADINIPYYVSNGYLIFIPEIARNVKNEDKLKESTIISVLSARDYLIKHTWVDSMRMGIAGHSQGGLQTNYLITNTNVFAAAVSGAGISDLVSRIGSLGYDNTSEIAGTENGVFFGTRFGDNPIEYLNYSPVAFAKSVSTPLLSLHNHKDTRVLFSQGMEFFQALRRLNKKVWLLDYYNEGHGILDPKSKLDFNIKMKQFFDYYLKGSEKPNWMLSTEY